MAGIADYSAVETLRDGSAVTIRAFRSAMGGARLGPAEGSRQEPIGHVSGTKEGDGFLMAAQGIL